MAACSYSEEEYAKRVVDLQLIASKKFFKVFIYPGLQYPLSMFVSQSGGGGAELKRERSL